MQGGELRGGTRRARHTTRHRWVAQQGGPAMAQTRLGVWRNTSPSCSGRGRVMMMPALGARSINEARGGQTPMRRRTGAHSRVSMPVSI
jgi:hypothetical protein